MAPPPPGVVWWGLRWIGNLPAHCTVKVSGIKPIHTFLSVFFFCPYSTWTQAAHWLFFGSFCRVFNWILDFSTRGRRWHRDACICNACAETGWYTKTHAYRPQRIDSNRRFHMLRHGGWYWGVFEACMTSRRARNLIIMTSSASHS